MATTRAALMSDGEKAREITEDPMSIPVELEEEVSASILDESEHKRVLRAFRAFGSRTIPGSVDPAGPEVKAAELGKERHKEDLAPDWRRSGAKDADAALLEQRMDELLRLETAAQLQEARAKHDEEAVELIESNGVQLDVAEIEERVLREYEILEETGAELSNLRFARLPIPPLCWRAECALPRQHYFFAKGCMTPQIARKYTPPSSPGSRVESDEDALPDDHDGGARAPDQAAWLSSAKSRSKALSAISSLISPSAVNFGRGLPVHASQDAIQTLRDELSRERTAKQVLADRCKLLEEEIRSQNKIIGLLQDKIGLMEANVTITALPQHDQQPAIIIDGAIQPSQIRQVVAPVKPVAAPSVWKPRKHQF